jgi:hypothetical protein
MANATTAAAITINGPTSKNVSVLVIGHFGNRHSINASPPAQHIRIEDCDFRWALGSSPSQTIGDGITIDTMTAYILKKINNGVNTWFDCQNEGHEHGIMNPANSFRRHHQISYWHPVKNFMTKLNYFVIVCQQH